jgi:hypothetical protein
MSRISPVATLLVAATYGTLGCAPSEVPRTTFDPGTPTDRAALFDYLLEKTMEREAFSPVKNDGLRLNVEEEMRQYRDELVAADTDEKLYYALAKISNARKDRHLRIRLLEGGLRPHDPAGSELSNYPVPGAAIPHAPVRFAVDFGTPGAYFLFIADVAENLPYVAPEAAALNVGDRLTDVNGQPFDDYVDAVEPYHRYSTVNGFWWQLATWLPQRSVQFPPSFFEEDLRLTLERPDGTRYTAQLPYLAPEDITWMGYGQRRYPGFHTAMTTETYTLYRPDDGGPVLLLAWTGFQDGLQQDVLSLMEYAEENGLLNSSLIIDATRSRGGSNGAFALRRFSPKPFRTTFGDLRISDASVAFATSRIERLHARERFPAVLGDGDDGGWLLSWIEEDFLPAADRGDEYTTPVPFKLRHLPKDSDGIVRPAEVHFTGRLVVWLSPYGGSHLDQFASMVVDNQLGHTMGMPAGGYSNTWEWEETLTFPNGEQPIVSYMWTIGHTVRPNGEILEGNPAEVDEFLPVTQETYDDYYPMLLRRSLTHLGIR